ncbi:DeoR/GlpR family DNA-binding transcription regulator [Spirosoma luteolum]
MNFQQRRALILQAVEERGTVDVPDLAALLATSAMTVRRDLAQLADDGLLYRTHGGAMRLADATVSFARKAVSHPERKEAICRRAAGEIQTGDVIFMDCGSTVAQLCPFIRHHRITVITNSLPVVSALSGSLVTINLIGGELDQARQAVHGQMATDHIGRYHADRAFLGVDGISLANGLSASGEQEASLTKAMAQQADRVYLLCDSSKLETEKYLYFAPLSLFDVLITDSQASPSVIDAYRQAGITVFQ